MAKHPLSNQIDPARIISEKYGRMDFTLLFLMILLSMIGIGMQYSAAHGSMLPWAMPQLVKWAVMMPIVLILPLIPIGVVMKSSYLFYILTIILLVVVEVMGHVGMGAQRWINIGGFTLQPSEFMKLTLVMAIAAYYHYVHPEDISRWWALIAPIILIAIPAALILKQPNLGTTVIVCAIGGSMMFFAGISWRYIIAAFLLVAISLPIAWQNLHDYQKRRVMTFLNPEEDPLGAGYNILQSMIAIGSGGWTGKGFIRGSQGQLEFVPEKQTDFIFTMVAEEWGFMGGMVVLFLLFATIWRCFMVGLRCEHFYGKLVSAGVGFTLFVHVFINVGMIMGLLPVVGVPLPFLSYGGSHLMAMMLAIAMVLTISVHSEEKIQRKRTP